MLAILPVTRHVGRWMFGGVVLFGVATIVFGVSRYFALSMLALVLLGAGDMVSVYIRHVLVQLETPDAIRGRVSATGGPVEVCVINDGPAIPAEHRERVFDPFFTTKQPGQGTGLGLAVSLSIVQSFGGDLVLAPGESTKFVITLPVAAGG